MAPIVGKVKAAANSWIAYATGLRHLFHKPYTLKFPQQRYAVEAGYRGRHLLHLDRSNGCGLSAWICPDKSITIVKTGDPSVLVPPRRFVKKGRLEKKPGHLVWKTPTQLKRGDYLTIPIAKETRDTDLYEQDVVVGQPSTGKRLIRKLRLKAEPDLFRL